jgi:adenosine kinase
VVVTRGSRGADLYAGDQHIHLPRVEMPLPPVDPMGCGDAFRAGLMVGISRQLDWQLTGRLANMIGAIKVTTAGCQNHFFDWEQLRAMYQRSYGEAWPLD